MPPLTATAETASSTGQHERSLIALKGGNRHRGRDGSEDGDLVQVIAQRERVHDRDDRQLMQMWEFADDARLGEVALRFIESGFLPTPTRPHAWLLRIVHEAQAVETVHGWWEWKPNGEGDEYVRLFRSVARGRHPSWQVSDASGHRLLDRAPLADQIRPGASGQRMVVANYLANAGLVSLPDFRKHVHRPVSKLRPLQPRRQHKPRPA
ncbi:hypothetical protein ACI2IX_19835 [Leifsonia aquatica]|uniref:hypothetical protein n=1 Tax=Leifsonia aquatica TaxID=144185 RepID=UPI00384BB14D